MISKPTFQLFILFFIFNSVYASGTDSCRKWRLTEMYIGVGDNGMRNEQASFEDFKKLAPASVLLNRDLNAYHPYWDYTGRNGCFILGMGFMSDRKINGPSCRIMIGYGGGSYMEGRYYRYTSFREDTLTSSKTGQQIYLDSVRNEQYTFTHQSDLLKFDVSLIWRTSNPNKMKLYAGVGINAGASLNAVTTLRYTRQDTYTPVTGYPYYSNYYNGGYSEIKETFMQKRQYAGSVYIPFGLDYRMSKTKSFWKILHPFLEGRAMLSYRKIPELSTRINAGFQLIAGLRVVFNSH